MDDGLGIAATSFFYFPNLGSGIKKDIAESPVPTTFIREYLQAIAK